eukprot:TRINITY_DN421_c0_g1_i2.p3 TRINITY_DN421_c0_g1~~TRINITY_DN421_c0_g1_i2.p3  ORF type:complete len:104 (-),score=28.71 TRINITY_DN421_c0_g1_i2:3-314(-)
MFLLFSMDVVVLSATALYCMHASIPLAFVLGWSRIMYCMHASIPLAFVLDWSSFFFCASRVRATAGRPGGVGFGCVASDMDVWGASFCCPLFVLQPDAVACCV